jgi:hypothetical protein
VPEGYRELPFEEESPPPTLSKEERNRGFMLFQRPITEPVHPNSHPHSDERLKHLYAFAAQGEFEPITFSLYPVRDLKNLRVRVSDLRGPNGATIPQSAIDLRLLTYWNIGFPRYSSRETYRRLPELLEHVTQHSSPARECQRWWITLHAPQNARPGLYHGKVTVWDDISSNAVEIPLQFRVFGFSLLSDPKKHFSVYYEYHNKAMLQGKSKAFIRRATDAEYQSMANHGLNMFPTLYLRYDRKRKAITVRGIEDLKRMKAAGLRGPIPVLGGNVIAALYSDATNGGKRGSHWKIDKIPPESFYTEITQVFKKLERLRRAKRWPEFVCCPLDEVDASRSEFGVKVYQAVRDAGFRTYATKNPLSSDAQHYRPAVDIWCSQPYAIPYEKIITQKRFEYWSYPNHNAGEIKNRKVMCKGGRMTYGFGFWRSGYTTLIPWHWAWTPGEDAFDYLRGERSGCGQRIDEEGKIIPSVYWECFREGYDDQRYLYTLQQSIWERSNTRSKKCRLALKKAQSLLQKIWDDIDVQQKYLNENMWPSKDFNKRRWELAMMIKALRQFPATRTDRSSAPSVLVKDTSPKKKKRFDTSALLDRAIAKGKMETLDIGGDFSQWKNSTSEGTLTITPKAGLRGKPGMRWVVNVDHHNGEKGHPIGWPRIYYIVPDSNGVDLTDYDYLRFRIRVDSNRNEVDDDTTPIGFTLDSNKFFEVSKDLGGQQRVWVSVIFPIRSIIESTGLGKKPWKQIKKFQVFIAESHYPHCTRLVFDISKVELLRFKDPAFRKLENPLQHIARPPQR